MLLLLPEFSLMPEPCKLPLSLLAFMPYNIPIIIYFRRDARCSAKSHGSWCAGCCPGAWRRATRGATAVCWPRRAAWPTAGGGALHRGRFARRGRAGVSGQRRACYPAGAFPHAGMLRLRLPHGGQRGIHPQDADALRRWFADRHAVLLAGPGLGRAPPMSVRPCSAGTPVGRCRAGRRRTERTGSGEVQGDLPANTILTPHPGEGRAAAGPDCARGAGGPRGCRRIAGRKISLRRRFKRASHTGCRAGAARSGAMRPAMPG